MVGKVHREWSVGQTTQAAIRGQLGEPALETVSGPRVDLVYFQKELFWPPMPLALILFFPLGTEVERWARLRFDGDLLQAFELTSTYPVEFNWEYLRERLEAGTCTPEDVERELGPPFGRGPAAFLEPKFEQTCPECEFWSYVHIQDAALAGSIFLFRSGRLIGFHSASSRSSAPAIAPERFPPGTPRGDIEQALGTSTARGLISTSSVAGSLEVLEYGTHSARVSWLSRGASPVTFVLRDRVVVRADWTPTTVRPRYPFASFLWAASADETWDSKPKDQEASFRTGEQSLVSHAPRD